MYNSRAVFYCVGQSSQCVATAFRAQMSHTTLTGGEQKNEAGLVWGLLAAFEGAGWGVATGKPQRGGKDRQA